MIKCNSIIMIIVIVSINKIPFCLCFCSYTDKATDTEEDQVKQRTGEKKQHGDNRLRQSNFGS